MSAQLSSCELCPTCLYLCGNMGVNMCFMRSKYTYLFRKVSSANARDQKFDKTSTSGTNVHEVWYQFFLFSWQFYQLVRDICVNGKCLWWRKCAYFSHFTPILMYEAEAWVSLKTEISRLMASRDAIFKVYRRENWRKRIRHEKCRI